MLGKIIEWSARNRFLVILATMFVTVGGIYAVVKTPLDAMPDLSDVQVIVYTEYPGQAPQVVEDQVTYPLTTRHAVGAEVESRARAFRSSARRSSTSSSRTAPTSTGRAPACSSTSTSPRAACPRASRRSWARMRPASAGSSNMRCVGARQEPGRIAHDPGLVPALPAGEGAGRGRGRQHRRLRAAVPGRRRSRASCAPTAFRSPR